MLLIDRMHLHKLVDISVSSIASVNSEYELHGRITDHFFSYKLTNRLEHTKPVFINSGRVPKMENLKKQKSKISLYIYSTIFTGNGRQCVHILVYLTTVKLCVSSRKMNFIICFNNACLQFFTNKLRNGESESDRRVKRYTIFPVATEMLYVINSIWLINENRKTYTAKGFTPVKQYRVPFFFGIGFLSIFCFMMKGSMGEKRPAEIEIENFNFRHLKYHRFNATWLYNIYMYNLHTWDKIDRYFKGIKGRNGSDHRKHISYEFSYLGVSMAEEGNYYLDAEGGDSVRDLPNENQDFLPEKSWSTYILLILSKYIEPFFYHERLTLYLVTIYLSLKLPFIKIMHLGLNPLSWSFLSQVRG